MEYTIVQIDKSIYFFICYFNNKLNKLISIFIMNSLDKLKEMHDKCGIITTKMILLKEC